MTAEVTTVGIAVLDYVAERTRRHEFTGQSPHTVRKTLWLFATEVGTDLPLTRLSHRQVEAWLRRQRVSPGTVRHRLSVIRAWCRWEIQQGRMRHDPTLGLRGPRAPRLVPKGLRADQVAAVFAECPDVRAVTIVSLMVQEGLRCCEVASLELGDIDFGHRSMLVRGKGGHERVLPVSDETWSALTRYLGEFPVHGGPLIRSYQHPTRALSAHYVSIYVGQLIHRAGIDAGAHALRHTAATDMLRCGAHVRDVQAALGHVSLTTTQRYLPWVVRDLRTAMAGRSYRSPNAKKPATPVATEAMAINQSPVP